MGVWICGLERINVDQSESKWLDYLRIDEIDSMGITFLNGNVSNSSCENTKSIYNWPYNL